MLLKGGLEGGKHKTRTHQKKQSRSRLCVCGGGRMYIFWGGWKQKHPGVDIGGMGDCVRLSV